MAYIFLHLISSILFVFLRTYPSLVIPILGVIINTHEKMEQSTSYPRKRRLRVQRATSRRAGIQRQIYTTLTGGNIISMSTVDAIVSNVAIDNSVLAMEPSLRITQR